VTPGGNNFNYVPGNQPTNYSCIYWLILDLYPPKFLRSTALRSPLGQTPLTNTTFKRTNGRVSLSVRRFVRSCLRWSLWRSV